MVNGKKFLNLITLARLFMQRKSRFLKYGIALIAVLMGCTRPTHEAASLPTPVNAGPAPIASDASADSLLVDVRQIDPSIAVEMRYATTNNFTGSVLPGYEANRAFLRREAAQALAEVQRFLAPKGLGLKIFDAYRPVRATEAMVSWTDRVNRSDLLADGYIANRSRHNLGVAVDLTLVDLVSGSEQGMGTAFDTFSVASHTDMATGSASRNRQVLRSAMQRAGFVPYEKEWWHFSFTVNYPVRFDRIIR